MKILIAAVNAKYIHSNLAVYSLYRYAGQYQDALEISEFTINQGRDQIMKAIFGKKPDVLCFSCYIWNISLIRELSEDLHKVLPNLHIWFGGPEVSYDAPKMLSELPCLTGIMKGEGEQTFLELVRHYVEKKKAFSEVAGIVWRSDSGEVRETAIGALLELSALPFPYQDIDNFQNRIIYYESSRGCPFSCSYCLSSIDKRLRFRSLDLVRQELQFFIDHKVKQVKFVDRTFNCNAERSSSIWRFLKENDNGITNFHFEIAADLLTQEEIDLLAVMRPGLVQLEIGVQSVNPRTLQAIRRTMDFSKVSEKVSQIRKGRNVHQHLDLIAGLPYEDYNSFRDSFNAVYILLPQQLQLGFLKVLKGSSMQEAAAEYECLFETKEPYEVLSTKWLSYEAVLKLKVVEEMVEVYYNSGQFQKTMPAVISLFSDPFTLYERLGEFYEQRGYLGISHTRMRRYEILLEFLKQYANPEEDYFRELLIFDLYARENLKSRPTWAEDQRCYKQAKQLFYQSEQKAHRYLEGYQAYDAKQMGKMTHIEVFHYNIMENEASSRKVKSVKEQLVLFDYRRRDPLTGNAVCHTVISKE